MSAFSERVGVPSWRMEPRHHGFEDLVNAAAFLGAGQNRPGAVEPDDLFDLPPRLFGLRTWQIDFVDDRNDLEIVLDGEIGVGQRLRLHALGGVDEQQRPFARRQRPGDFIAEIDVPGRIDQVQDVGLPVVGLVVQPDWVGLDRDPSLALEVHAVEHLGRHFTELEGPRRLEKAIGER